MSEILFLLLICTIRKILPALANSLLVIKLRTYGIKKYIGTTVQSFTCNLYSSVKFDKRVKGIKKIELSHFDAVNKIFGLFCINCLVLLTRKRYSVLQAFKVWESSCSGNIMLSCLPTFHKYKKVLLSIKYTKWPWLWPQTCLS